ncbi:MAG TPA: HAD family hydrolase [Verrucomicrobiae bacterium]|nr:HAD family hydrolase [Verrucomicrobiae bacterium]
MTLVMFDVDGTLTHSNELDTRCFVQAIEEAFGFTGIDEDWSRYTHTSDAGILEELFQRRLGRSPTTTEIETYRPHFLQLLGAGLQQTPMREVAGAGDILNALATHPDYAVSLASGAWRDSARAKMLSAGLPIDRFPGAFSEDAPARNDIMLAARSYAAQRHQRAGFDQWVYFGDAVWDARACAELGVPLIGIGCGEQAEKLRRAGAFAVFSDYSAPETIMASIERAARSGATKLS